MAYNKSKFNKDDNDFIGRLFMNDSKSGKKYLKGRMFDKDVVGFYSDKSNSYVFKIADPLPDNVKKPAYKKPKSDDDSPF